MEQNWSRNVTFGAARVHTPTEAVDVQRVVAEATHVRVVGSGHSFNDLVSTEHDLISLDRMDRVTSIDPEQRSVRIEGGSRYHTLSNALAVEGLALPNLASIPHFNVAGATATGTHGSGDTNRCLATRIAALDLVSPTGDVVTVDRDTPDGHLDAIAIGLGAFGVITALTLDVVPAFQMAQQVYLDVPLDVGIEHFDEIMAAAYSVSWFLDWQSDRIQQIWLKHTVADGHIETTPEDFFGGERAAVNMSPRGPEDGDRFTRQDMTRLPSHQVLPHVHPDVTATPGGELQSEYFVPRRHAAGALRAVAAQGPAMGPFIRAAEVRTVDADELWLSPFVEPTLALHFSWETTEIAAVEAFLPELEAALEPFEVRPHWGKMFAWSGERVRSRYQRFDDWAALVASYDPDGCFRNPFLDRLLG